MALRWQDIVVDGEIHIPPDVWAELKTDPAKTTALLLQAISEGSVPVPLNPIKEEDALADFRRLRELPTLGLLQEQVWEPSTYSYRNALSRKVLRSTNVGLRASDFFHQENRLRCDGRGYPSAYRTWQEPKYLKGLFKALWTMKHSYVDSRVLRKALEVRKYVAPQFRPAVAKTIYECSKARSILDFSAGWGDRLAAALATDSVEHYTAVDPNARLFPGYREQVRILSRCLEGPKDITLVNTPAEEMVLEREFDLVFTSPPYFDKERYTNDASQSWVRYRSVSKWLSEFLFEALRRAWEHLRAGGFLCINISDALSKRREEGSKRRLVDAFVDPMNDFLSSLPGALYEGAIGMKMAARPGASGKHEPIWVWRRAGGQGPGLDAWGVDPQQEAFELAMVMGADEG